MHDALGTLRDVLGSLPHLQWWITGAWLLYLVPLCAWIVLQKREPVATLSWLLSLALLPYIGYLIYFLLGPQRIKRHQLRRTRARAGLDRYEVFAPTDGNSAELPMLAQKITGLPPSSATSVQQLVDGCATYQAILDAIAAAENHIHLEYYIFNGDRTGQRVLEALTAKAREGVKVRLLLDAVGSNRLKKRALRPLVDAGGEYAWFHPTRFRPFTRPWLNLRTHRKIVVVDGRIAFTGGINVTDDEDESLRGDAYRDLHLRLEGEIVRSIQQVFVEDWVYATGQQRKDFQGTRLWSAADANIRGGIAAQALVSGPDSAWEPIHRMKVAAIHEAKQRVCRAKPHAWR
jgi:cardiolipin synthase A/B